MAFREVMRVEYGSQGMPGNPSWENTLSDWLFNDVADKLNTRDLANLFARLEARGVKVEFSLQPKPTRGLEEL